MKHRTLVTVVAFAVAAVLAAEVGDAWARARGGGSRGSRSYSAPARPSPVTPGTPTSPSRSLNQPTPASAPPMQRPGFFSGLGGALAGFALGGLLGGLLFGGFGRGFGIGFMDILIVAGVAMLVWHFLKRRRESETPAYATAGAGASRYGATAPATGASTLIGMAGSHTREGELERGVAHVRQMDAGFNPESVADWARTLFGSVQSAVAMRDVGILRDRLTPEMYNVLQGQCQELKTARRTNSVEKVVLDRAEVTEVWQEGGYDFVTVWFTGSMLDYTVDDKSGDVIEGSKTDPQTIEEFWTFTRPVGPNKWKLTAIQSA